MRRRILFLFWIALGLLFLASSPSPAREVPPLKGYVNDYAGMISPQVRDQLEQELRAFEQSDSTQLVILTVPSLEGEPIESFGIRVAEAWKIGQQNKDNGIIFIVARQDRRIRIEVGRGLEGRLTDLLAGRIIDLVVNPRFKRGDFDGGFQAGAAALIDAVRGEFKADPARPKGVQKVPSFFAHLVFGFVFLLVFASFSRILGGLFGMIGLPAVLYAAFSPVSFAFLILAGLVGLILGLTMPLLFLGTSRVRWGRPVGGGGFFSSGGGGWSSGGFGGGFSGGGGSFGGGGASGSW